MKLTLVTILFAIISSSHLAIAEKNKSITLVEHAINKEINAFPSTIPDGSVIVFQRGKSVGYAIIRNQKAEPETFDYEWFLREDGKPHFITGSPGLKTGKKSKASSIKFGPFDSEWSINRDGRGFVYLHDNYYTGIIFSPDIANIIHDLIGMNLIKKLKGKEIQLFIPKPTKPENKSQ